MIVWLARSQAADTTSSGKSRTENAMYVLKSANGLLWAGRFDWTDREKDARMFATPKAANRKLAALAANGVADLAVAPTVGTFVRPPKKVPATDAAPQSNGRKGGRKKSAEPQSE